MPFPCDVPHYVLHFVHFVVLFTMPSANLACSAYVLKYPQFENVIMLPDKYQKISKGKYKSIFLNSYVFKNINMSNLLTLQTLFYLILSPGLGVQRNWGSTVFSYVFKNSGKSLWRRYLEEGCLVAASVMTIPTFWSCLLDYIRWCLWRVELVFYT